MSPDSRPDEAARKALERLALSDYTEAAQAVVDDVVLVGDRAAVILLLNGDYEYSVYFQRGGEGDWQEAGSLSGRTDATTLASLDWDQP
jgi:hypothetical protein